MPLYYETKEKILRKYPEIKINDNNKIEFKRRKITPYTFEEKYNKTISELELELQRAKRYDEIKELNGEEAANKYLLDVLRETNSGKTAKVDSPQFSPFGIKYRAELTLENESFTDFNTIMIVRSAIVKKAPYIIVDISLPKFVSVPIEESIRREAYLDIKLKIYGVKDQTVEGEFFTEIPILERTYKLINIVSIPFADSSIRDKVRCRLILVNRLLHEISLTNTFNCVLTSESSDSPGITAYSALMKFEEYLKTQYGSFTFRHVGINNKLQNKYQYEQILIKTTDDLNVPDYIINTYKPFQTYGFYFFDDFNLTISDTVDGPIVGNYVNLYDLTTNYKTFDIRQYSDIRINTKFIKSIPFTDVDRTLLKHNPFCFIHNREMNMTLNNSEGQIWFKSQTLEKKSSELAKDRILSIKDTNIQFEKFDRAFQHVCMYSPDSPENAIQRINTMQDLLNDKINSIEFFETVGCFPDWLQFGYLYNLNIGTNRDEVNIPISFREESDYFNWTPISIINIFNRISKNSNELIHGTICSMLRFHIDSETPKIGYSKNTLLEQQLIEVDARQPTNYVINQKVGESLVKKSQNSNVKNNMDSVVGWEKWKNMTKRFEGLVLNEYRDSRGIRTIGYGHNLEAHPYYPDGTPIVPPITKEQAEILFEADYARAKRQAEGIPGYHDMNEGGKAALIDMVFNMGKGNVNKFVKMRQAISANNYDEAAKQVLKSRYAQQVGRRAQINAMLIKNAGGKA